MHPPIAGGAGWALQSPAGNRGGGVRARARCQHPARQQRPASIPRPRRWRRAACQPHAARRHRASVSPAVAHRRSFPPFRARADTSGLRRGLAALRQCSAARARMGPADLGTAAVFLFPPARVSVERNTQCPPASRRGHSRCASVTYWPHAETARAGEKAAPASRGRVPPRLNARPLINRPRPVQVTALLPPPTASLAPGPFFRHAALPSRCPPCCRCCRHGCCPPDQHPDHLHHRRRAHADPVVRRTVALHPRHQHLRCTSHLAFC